MTGNRTLYLSRPGLVCACGLGIDALWEGVLKADRSTMRTVHPAFGNAAFYAATVTVPLPPQPDRPDTHIARMTGAALRQLDGQVAQALSAYGKGRIGVCVGGCDNGSELSIRAHRDYAERGSFPASYALEMQGAGSIAAAIRDQYGLEGPATAAATACSSSGTAVVKAAQLIRAGICDAMITGGADIVSDLELLGFNAMECISPAPSNPFSANRSGLTLGEAAVFFVLSKDPLGEERPHVTLAGYGETADAVHITSPDAKAGGAIAAIRQALDRAGIGPDQVDYINLHGTGTLQNDAMEALAVSTVFGSGTPCSSTKSITGHTLGAAGAISLAVCREALVRNRGAAAPVLPAQAWDGSYDSRIPPIRIVDREHVRAEKKDIRYCMGNFFGFGGVNVSLLLHLEEDDV